MATKIEARNHNHFADKLWSLKNHCKFCDAAIVVNGQKIPVHAVVLASSSDFFERAFENAGSTKEVTFKDVDLDVLMVIIEFCYTGFIKITENNVEEVCRMAGVLSMTTIIESCSEILQQILNVNNSLSIWKIARTGKLEGLTKISLDLSRKNFEEVCGSQEFLDLEFLEVNELLSSEVTVKSETIVLEAVKKWINNDKTSRKGNLTDLLDHVKLERLPKNILCAEFYSLCDDSNDKCYQKFSKALEMKEYEGTSGDHLIDNGESALDTEYDDLVNSKCKEFTTKYTLIAVGDDSLENSKKADIYDIVKQEWVQIDVDFGKKYFSAVFQDNKLMTIGGRSKYESRDVEYYNLITREKESLPSMKYERSLTTTVKCKGNIYVIGGYNAGHTLGYLEMWNPSTKTWQDLTPMLKARRGFGAVVIKDEIYVMGGHYSEKNEYLSEVEVYDTVNDKWRFCQPMQEKRWAPGVALIGKYVYVVGGSNENSKLKTVERYDVKNNNWTYIQSIEVPRYWIEAKNFNGQLVIVGGCTWKAVSIVERYDVKNNKWEPMATLKTPRWVFNLVEIPWDLAQQVLSENAPK